MMKLTITGAEELRAALRQLPAELAAEAGAIVAGAAERTAAAARSAYESHRHTGALAEGVSVIRAGGSPLAAVYRVRSGSRLAVIFERGTQARHYVTVRGRTHVTGRMPAARVLVPAAERARAAMMADLVALVERAGLTVTG